MSKITFCAIILALFVASSIALSAQNLMANASYEPLEIVANIALGKSPYSVAVNDVTNRVYVGVDRGLMVINGETDQIIAEIPLDNDVIALAVNPLTNRIYAGVYGANIVVIDGATDLTVGTIPEGIYDQYELAVNPVTNRVYVEDRSIWMGEYDCVTVYNGENFQHVASVELGLSSYIENVGVTVNPSTNQAYATWSGNNSLYRIDGETHAVTGNVGPSSFSETVMVNSYTNYVYVGNAVLNGETLEEVTPDYTGQVEAIDPVHNLLYTVASYDTLWRLNGSTHAEIDSLELQSTFIPTYDQVAVNPNTAKIYINNWAGNQTWVVSAGTLPQPSPSPSPSPSPTPSPSPSPSPTPSPTESPTPTATPTPTPTSTSTPSPSPTETPAPSPTPTPTPSPTVSPTPTPTPSPSPSPTAPSSPSPSPSASPSTSPSPTPSGQGLTLSREVIYAVVAAIIIAVVAVVAVVLKKRRSKISKAPMPPPPPPPPF